MAKYTLISSDGHPYITGTDRAVLNALIAAGAVRGCTARKHYQIRGSQDLGQIIARLKERAEDSRRLSCERTRAAGMLKKINQAMDAGDLFLEMEAWSGSRREGKYHFFKHNQNN